MRGCFRGFIGQWLLPALLAATVGLVYSPQRLAGEVIAIPVELTDVPQNQYWAAARVFSVVPAAPLESFRNYTGGGVGPTGTLTLGVHDAERRFEVSIAAKVHDGKFLATVTVEVDKADKQTERQQLEFDLTDLAARSLDLAQDADGRVFRLSLMPTIIAKDTPREFKVSNLALEYLSFSNSPLILNDQDYLGSLSMASGPLAWCDIPGLAKVEFSLLPLKDAKPLGTLKDGRLKIEHPDGESLEISSVMNGAHREVLAGGPYKVWVRWLPPTQSVEEHRKEVDEQLAALREDLKNGAYTLPPGTLKRMEKRHAKSELWLINSGVRAVEKDELTVSPN